MRTSKRELRPRLRPEAGRRNRPRSRERPRERSGNPDFCYYHRTFGDRAYNASLRANGCRETGPAVRKSGRRRRHGLPPHFCHRQGDADVLSRGHWGRHKRVSPQQNTPTNQRTDANTNCSRPMGRGSQRTAPSPSPSTCPSEGHSHGDL